MAKATGQFTIIDYNDALTLSCHSSPILFYIIKRSKNTDV